MTDTQTKNVILYIIGGLIVFGILFYMMPNNTSNPLVDSIKKDSLANHIKDSTKAFNDSLKFELETSDRQFYFHKIAVKYKDSNATSFVIEKFINEVLVVCFPKDRWGLTQTERKYLSYKAYWTAKKETTLGTTGTGLSLNNHVGMKYPRNPNFFTWSSNKASLNYMEFKNWTYSYLSYIEYCLNDGKNWLVVQSLDTNSALDLHFVVKSNELITR